MTTRTADQPRTARQNAPQRVLPAVVSAVVLLCLGVAMLWAASPRSASAYPALQALPTATPEGAGGPKRQASIQVSITTYKWWLSYWSNNQVACEVFTEHEGLPNADDVQYYCGNTVLAQWLATKPCIIGQTVTDISKCGGLYLHLVSVTPGERTIKVTLAPPKVYVSLEGCEPSPPQNRCDRLPNLLLTGEEPLPNEDIIRIQGTIGGQAFSCPGAVCALPLPPTGNSGVPVEFWADSSFGDQSEHFTAQVRTIPWGDFISPDQPGSDTPSWYVDVISAQWRGAPTAQCSQIWTSFPPMGGPPAWLQTPDQPEQLASAASYYYLAGSMIESHLVDAAGCPDGGLQGAGLANECGMSLARPQVQAWQNQFDSEILRVANDTGVPAQMMKNVFSRESQFWPGYFQSIGEAGLGALTEDGADTALLWNYSFYSQFCPLVLEASTCQTGFAYLAPELQAMLRGAMVGQVNAACPDCPTKIDLSQANYSISIFARSMLANCEQVGQIVYNATGQVPGDVVPYEDLWRFTLLNYNAGPGCLSNSVAYTLQQREPLNWGNVAYYLEPVCQLGVPYVNEVSRVLGEAEPTPTPQLPTPIFVTPALTRTAAPGARTATPGGRTATPGPSPTTGPTPTPGPATATPPAGETGIPYPYPTYEIPPTATEYYP